MQPKFIGRILAVIGLVLLISSVLTFAIGATAMGVGKVVIAVVFFAVFVATNIREVGKSRASFFYTVSAVAALLVVALLAVGNYVAAKHPINFDLTKNKIHTLSADTVKTLEGLKEDVHVLAFYKAGETGYEALNELFTRYGARSEHFKAEFIDPLRDPVKVKEYGIREDKPRVVVKLGKTESRFQELTEEALTNALVKVTHSSTKKVYFTTGHGEADPAETGGGGMSEVTKRMENEGLKSETLNLATSADVPADAATLLIAGPTRAFMPGEVEVVRRYLDQGGKAFIMLEPQTVTGLEALLKAYNVEADNTLVIDPISRLFGASDAMPVVQNYNRESEITRDFQLNTVFPTARPLTIIHDDQQSTAQPKPLALSMPTAWGETHPDAEKLERNDDEKGGPFPLVVTVTKDTKSATAGKRGDEARLVVAGDRDFASNKYRAAVGNEDFFLNCVNWLSEQTERITIRPRMRDASRLYLTEGQQASIFFVAIDILPVTLLAVGLVVWMTRRSK